MICLTFGVEPSTLDLPPPPPPTREQQQQELAAQAALDEDLVKIKAAKTQEGEMAACIADAKVTPAALEKLLAAGVRDLETLALLGKADFIEYAGLSLGDAAKLDAWLRAQRGT